MSVTILSGFCRGGPWDGTHYTKSAPAYRAGHFNLIGACPTPGAYTHGFEGTTPVWRWGPWIDGEPERTEP